MNNMKKCVSFFLSVFMVLTLCVYNNSFCAKADKGGDDKYDIVVTKVVMNSLENWPKKQDGKGTDINGYTGGRISNLQNYFGDSSKAVSGVWFELHKCTEDGKDGKVVKEGKTGDDGTLRFEGLEKGKYVIVENKEKSSYKDKDNDNKELAESKAVPVTVVLPVVKADGTYFTNGDNALFVYPKSTVDKPKIDKYIGDEKNKEYSVTSFVGEKKTFTIESVMPEGISDYKVLKYTDESSEGLSFEGLSFEEDFKVTLNGTEIDGSKNGTEIDTSKYELHTQEVGSKGIEFDVTFKEDFIKTLKKGDKIKISYSASVNEKAKMGFKNDNKAYVEYGVNSNSLKKEEPANVSEIHTGGIRFKKVDSSSKDKLSGAEFIIMNHDNKYIGEENGKLKLVDNEDNAKKYISGDDGIIDIKGLPYGTFYIKETKAPEGYAKLSDKRDFEINENSYYDSINSEKLKNPSEIENTKITIPQTGGSGSIMIIGAGFVIFCAGVFLKKKILKA